MLNSNTEALRAGKKVTLVGVAVNGLLILFKFAAGFFGQSQALIADAVHSISDLFTDAVVLLGLKLGSKAPDEKHHFGHARMETLASAAVGMALMLTALFLGVSAGLNIYHNHVHHPTWLALVAAGLSIAFKEALYQYTIRTGRRIKSQLIIANAWHHRSDALSSVAVLCGVAGSMIRPSWAVLDSCAALLVSCFIVKVGADIILDTLREFTDAAPEPEVLDRIHHCAMQVNGVTGIHDLRVRTSGGLYQMETHIVVDGRLTVEEGHRIAKLVERCLIDEVDRVDRVIIHVDPTTEPKKAT